MQWLYGLRVRPRSWAVVTLILIGLALRLGLTLPAHTSIAEADCTLTGLCAFKVLRGEGPVFFSYFRIGSLGCHLAALLFLIGGATRGTLMIGPAIVGLFLMLAWYSFLRSIFDRTTAAVGLVFIAVPSPAVSLWLSMPNGYPETMLLCATILMAAGWCIRRPGRAELFFAFGLAVGLGLWSSLLSLTCSVPAALWLVAHQPRVLTRVRDLGLAGAGFLIGAAPWLVFNLLYRFASLRSNFATQAPPGPGTAFANGVYVLSYQLPELVASIDRTLRPAHLKQLDWLPILVILVHVGAVLLGFFVLLRPCVAKRGVGELRWHGSPALIFALVSAVTIVLNVFSGAGSIRGTTVRYVLPLYLIVPGLLAVSLRWSAKRSKLLAGMAAASLLAFNIAGAYLPWTQEHGSWREKAAKGDRLVRLLENDGVGAVMGDYWAVYPINFLSKERIKGIPWAPQNDHYQVVEQLDGATPVRWALLVQGWRHRHLAELADQAGIDGEIRAIDDRSSLFLVRPAKPAQEFVSHIREVFGRNR